LIRHCESQNNVDNRDVVHVFKISSSMTLATFKQIGSLMTFPMDTPLSALGIEQYRQQARHLEDAKLVEKYGISLILHSHLIRADATCKGLFVGHENKMMKHTNMYEKDIPEHVGKKDLAVRTEAIKRYLLNRPEQTIVLVGHSAVFRDLMGRAEKVQNCDVWEVPLRGTKGRQEESHNMQDFDVTEDSCRACAKKIKKAKAKRCNVCGLVFHEKCVTKANQYQDFEVTENTGLRIKGKVCQQWDIDATAPEEQYLLFEGGNKVLEGTPFWSDKPAKADADGSRKSDIQSQAPHVD